MSEKNHVTMLLTEDGIEWLRDHHWQIHEDHDVSTYVDVTPTIKVYSRDYAKVRLLEMLLGEYRIETTW
jgi:hypothetical protein